jgi:para-aminobenzoate synthetase component 1
MADDASSERSRLGRSRPRIEELDPPPDPIRCVEALADLPCPVFLDSATRGGRLGRYSFVMADPVALVRSHGARTEYRDVSAGERWRPVSGTALEAVCGILRTGSGEPVPGLPPFQGGAAGYIAYEWGHVLEPRLPSPPYDDLGLPDVIFGIYDWVLAWDHSGGGAPRAWLISTGLPEPSPAAREARAAERAWQVRSLLARSTRGGPLARPSSLVEAQSPGDTAPSWPLERGGWDPKVRLRSSFTESGYLDAVARVREYILAGDIFQANLSQRFEAPLRESPWSFYRRLRERNAAPFAAYLDFADFAVLSASPERFLRLDVSGHVETRPIKGTRPRGFGPEHDAALGQALVESAKDRAENLMIVDLMRNDLSRVCRPGTVRVEELFALEGYARVHHLVSTVGGELETGRDATDLLAAAFPGGSITGAPKIRAMEIIAEMEPSVRGVYCGAIGYWSVTGALDMNIAIRTVLTRGGRAVFNAGGGIVADSDPGAEYRETLDKARGIIDALPTPV